MRTNAHNHRRVARGLAAALMLTLMTGPVLVAPALLGRQAVAAPATGPVLLATPAPRRPHPHRKPWPITMTVQTVPPLPGLRLTLDGVKAVTDGKGRASFTQEHNFAPHTLRLLDTRVTSPSKRMAFTRWAGQRDPDQAFRATVTGLPMRMSYTVIAAFAVQVPVSTSLVDLQGAVVDPSRVTAMTIKSGRQGELPIPGSGRLWLDSLVPVYRDSGFKLVPETYSLTSVMVSGTNTIDVGSQQFQPVSDQAPVFHAKFFSMAVTAHDLLLKDPTGTAARVTYPDGTVHTIPFPPSGRVVIPDLPRGTYQVTAQAGGTALAKQLVLSRDSTVDVGVATHVDYALLGGGIVLVMAVLLLVGRARHWAVRQLVRLRSRTAATPAPGPDESSERVDQDQRVG